MLKEERIIKILALLKEQNIIHNVELVKKLNVSEMTVRRDIEYLERKNKLVRVHGGIKSIILDTEHELSHNLKQNINIKEKTSAVLTAISLLNEKDIIFLGTGTTLELFAKYLKLNNLTIITNSLPVFDSFKNHPHKYEIILTGGHYRAKTGAFVGSITNSVLMTMHFNKAFIGANGVDVNGIYTANTAEVEPQKIALDRAQEKYVVVDNTKLEQKDFYCFYALSKLTGLIVDKNITNTMHNKYKKLVNVII